MDLSAIKAKLEALSNSDREKVDYSKIFWKPTGKHEVRIVPSMYNPSFPFTELKFHYGVGKMPMIALSNFGKQDPIEEFIKELRKTSDKDNWSLAGKLTPRSRIFAPVIVRGEEDQGVRLWGFGVTIYKALLSLAGDEDVGDFTDPINGLDLVVKVDQVAGKQYPETSVRPRMKQTPLSKDDKQVELWLKNQPDPMTAFSQYDYDFLKNKLQEFLTPTTKSDIDAEPAKPVSAPVQSPASAPNFTVEKATSSTVVASFDDLFGEPSNTGAEVDDLPF